MSKYTTGEIAKLCGVSVRTVQYYDTRGILVPSDLSEGGRRLYSEDDLSKMKIICFLRELDLPIDTIGKLMKEENSNEVVHLIFAEQAKLLQSEINAQQKKLERLEELNALLKNVENFSVRTIGDMAHIMENKKKLHTMRWMMILTGIPVSALQWVSIILWIIKGIWWLFAAWAVIATVWGVIVSRYYFGHTKYICPNCHNVFKPTLKEAFWANHTPNTRKLTCPVCAKKSFCVETYSEAENGK